MTTLKRKGHRLETVGVNGGRIAGCSCGKSYNPPKGQVWAFWDVQGPKVRKMHQDHLAALN